MNSDTLLMVFAKNPVLGTTKTRLAHSVGDQKALEIYKFLLQYTAYIALEADCDRQVHYSSYTDYEDMFPNESFTKTVQPNGELGTRMYRAFEQAFHKGYKKVAMIGSDCYELSTDLIDTALTTLQNTNFVLGPATDGGYYLLGMRQLEYAIFRNKQWSTPRVYHDTLIDLEVLNYSYAELPVLSDIDYVDDIPVKLRDKFGI
jgi:rSAM/selenodomain-associated transferase 1